MQAVLANPRGFCAGVVRAIEIVERALALYGVPIYVLHQDPRPLLQVAGGAAAAPEISVNNKEKLKAIIV